MDDVALSQTTAHLVGQYLGNYRLVKLLGQGGFATVYLGKHRYLGTFAAVKVLHTRQTQDELHRFLHEARTTARLVHPHIVRVLDFGLEGSLPFLVTELASYRTLGHLYSKGYPVSPATVIQYTRQVATALQYIHDKGLIHQDVKPENILLGEDRRALLSDFGISVAAHKVRTIGRQEVVGTVSYMAPEQIRGQPCEASDQYALGVVVYKLLTGTLPFEGSTFDIVQQHLYEAPPPLRSTVPTLPPAVERVVLKALAKRPEERFGNVHEFAEALEQAYRRSFTEARHSRPNRRKKHVFLREAAALLAACLIIGLSLSILLRALGPELGIFWLCLILLLTALPLVIGFLMRNHLAFLCASGVFALSGFFGLVFHSLPVFLSLYIILSFPSMLVAFSLGIQDEHTRS